MKTITIYYVILCVYISLWSCQILAGHLTHSLIILTDSYVNLYRILDISLGILHLCTQRQLTASRTKAQQEQQVENDSPKKYETLAGRLFECACTYQFKRLPLLGSFINGLFLAAFLMSAAIEGLQTCFHTGHSQGHEAQSILERDPLTYPLMLIAMALVGLVMQQCSLKAHEMREEELQSESLLDLSGRGRSIRGTSGESAPPPPPVPMIQLNVVQLEMPLTHVRRASASSANRRSYDLNHTLHHGNSFARVTQATPCNSSLQELPTSSEVVATATEEETKISLKSLKFASDLESIELSPIGNNLNVQIASVQSKKSRRDFCFIVRYLTSPVALVSCAAIAYYISDELITEVLDALLSVAVVVLLFVASYPPMKQAGRVLLQTAPDGVDLVKLEAELLQSSPYVLKVCNLHVWSLTPRSNRVATCELLLDKCADSEVLIRRAINEAKFKFLDQNIKCTTIEPKFEEDKHKDHEHEHKHHEHKHHEHLHEINLREENGEALK